jgi:hypothetical protein
LGVGDITLSRLARANAFALIAPGDEGRAGGEPIAVTPFSLSPPRSPR